MITNENNFRVVDTKKGKIKYYQNDIFDKLKEIALRKNIFTLTSKFETIIKRSGYGNYIDEIRNQGIRSKPIIGQYVASKIVKNKEPIPKQFNTVLNYVNK